jgi:hypothetical protein
MVIDRLCHHVMGSSSNLAEKLVFSPGEDFQEEIRLCYGTTNGTPPLSFF